MVLVRVPFKFVHEGSKRAVIAALVLGLSLSWLLIDIVGGPYKLSVPLHSVPAPKPFKACAWVEGMPWAETAYRERLAWLQEPFSWSERRFSRRGDAVVGRDMMDGAGTKPRSMVRQGMQHPLLIAEHLTSGGCC